MKISYNWLQKYVLLKDRPEGVAGKLTSAGMEVEAMERVGGDTVMEMEVTPNRPDCLSMIGVAREICALTNKPLKAPGVRSLNMPGKKCPVTVEDRKACPRYIGTLIEGVDVRPAPAETRNLLQGVGVRSINNVVDITNFCLMESGQPLHAFDYDRLAGGRVIVRRAREGEKIVTIDGEERKLDPSVLVIADAEKPVAVAGIMGGLETEVSGKTRIILLESACFDPVLIRQAARRLGVASDSSYRFERGIDIAGVQTAARRAASLILREAGGRLAAYADVFPARKKRSSPSVRVSCREMERLLGARIPFSRCKTILTRLGFSVLPSGKQGFRAGVPSFRGDIRSAEDIIEEIARIYGYGRIAPSLPEIRYTDIREDAERPLRAALRAALSSQGLNEMITYAMTSREALAKCRLESLPAVAVKNPLTVEQELMRPSLLPGALSVLAANMNKGQKDIRLYEIGKVYPPGGERETLSLLMTGRRYEDWRMENKEPVDFLDLKGVVENVFARLRVGDAVFRPRVCPYLEEGQAAGILIDGELAGEAGKLSREVLASWDIKQTDVFFASLDLTKIYPRAEPPRAYLALSSYPGVGRDISLALPDATPYARVRQVVRGLGGPLLQSVELVEEYRGEKIPAGMRGLTVSLTYQSRERTLREEEIEEIHAGVCQGLVDELKAVRR